jgi:hypothetical protein
MWRNKFSHLLNLHGFNDVRQSEKHKAEPLVPELAPFEVEVATGKLKHTNHLIVIKFQQNCFKLALEYFFPRFINLLTTGNKKELPYQWKEAILVPFYRKGDKTEPTKY